MYKKITLLGKTIPIWIIVALLITSGAGAAVGTILSGSVIGEINVSTTGSASGLLIGPPICDYIVHTPNDAVEDNSDNDVGESPTTWIPDSDFVYMDLDGMAFSDNLYATTPAVGANISQQIFKIFVGNESNITRIRLDWEGKTSKAGGKLQVYEDIAWDTDMEKSTSITDTTLSIIIKSSTDATIAEVVKDGWVYIQAFSPSEASISTDYLSVRVDYTAFDFETWDGFNGEPAVTRSFTVPGRCIGVNDDSQTAFEAASEIGIGDWWLFALPIQNASSQDITAKLTLTVPECMNIHVFGADEVNETDYRISGVTVIGKHTWKVLIDGNANKQDDDDYLYIVINPHDYCIQGHFTFGAILEQIPY